ncbi:MAG TPA: PrsW family intramembrane metalloprotease [Candidatus Moranbacteria bacterium]|nr:PrsW family intramembrane metalloprotease [Candidatus Moranbacteria bacterium]
MIAYKLVLIASLIGIVPAIIWLWLIIKGGQHAWLERQKMLKFFFWGVLTAIPVGVFGIMIAEYGGESIVLNLIKKIFRHDLAGGITMTLFATTLLMAFLEEFFKGVAILAALLKEGKTDLIFGITIGVIIGLAFAVTENGVYFVTEINSGASGALIFRTVFLRFILSTSAHIIYSAFMGALMSKAFSSKNYLSKITIIFSSLLLATTIHTLFNLLLIGNYSFLVPLVILTGFIVLGVIYGFSKK